MTIRILFPQEPTPDYYAFSRNPEGELWVWHEGKVLQITRDESNLPHHPSVIKQSFSLRPNRNETSAVTFLEHLIVLQIDACRQRLERRGKLNECVDQTILSKLHIRVIQHCTHVSTRPVLANMEEYFSAVSSHLQQTAPSVKCLPDDLQEAYIAKILLDSELQYAIPVLKAVPSHIQQEWTRLLPQMECYFVFLLGKLCSSEELEKYAQSYLQSASDLMCTHRDLLDRLLTTRGITIVPQQAKSKDNHQAIQKIRYLIESDNRFPSSKCMWGYVFTIMKKAGKVNDKTAFITLLRENGVSIDISQIAPSKLCVTNFREDLSDWKDFYQQWEFSQSATQTQKNTILLFAAEVVHHLP